MILSEVATSHKVASLAGWGLAQDARALVELKGQVAFYMAHSNIKQIITHHNKKYVCIEVN